MTDALRQLRVALDELALPALAATIASATPYEAPWTPFETLGTHIDALPGNVAACCRLLWRAEAVERGEIERALSAELVRELLRTGFLHVEGGRVDLSGRALLVHGGVYVLADVPAVYPTAHSPRHVHLDRDTLYLSRLLPGRPRRTVIEVGTGCALLAMLATASGARVYATELDAVAANVARCSVALNGLSDRIEIVEGDLFAGVPRGMADLVIANPPYAAVPRGKVSFLAADGGPDGLAVVRRILAELDGHLAPDGEAFVLAGSYGDEVVPFCLSELREHAARGSWALDVVSVDRTPATTYACMLSALHGDASFIGAATANAAAVGASAFYVLLLVLRRAAGAGRLRFLDAMPSFAARVRVRRMRAPA